MAKMTVNINNMRRQAALALHRLTVTLNRSIMPRDSFASHTINGEEREFSGDILLSTEEIQHDMETLRGMVGGLLMLGVEGDKDFRDMYDETFPNDDFAWFNEENEDE